MRDFNDHPTKSAVRRRYRELLHGVHPADRVSEAEKIQDRIEGLPQWAAATSLVAYCAIGHEVPVRRLMADFLARSPGRLYLPRYDYRSDSYELAAISDMTVDLSPGRYGILEPRRELPAVSHLAEPLFWLVPGVAFSVSGDRLGRGGGYYDRLFASFAVGFRVGVAWQCQMAAALPVSGWDARMALVVTENRIYPAV